MKKEDFLAWGPLPLTPLRSNAHTHTLTHALPCYFLCPAGAIFCCEAGENREGQLAQWRLPEDDLIYRNMTCLQLLLSADKQQHAAHKDTFAKHIDTRASAKLTQSKWIKKPSAPGGATCSENRRGDGKRRRDRDVYRQSNWHVSFIANIIMCSSQQWGKPVSEIAGARISCPISSSPWDKWREQGCWEWSDSWLPLDKSAEWMRLRSVLAQKSHRAFHTTLLLSIGLDCYSGTGVVH